MWSHGVEHLKTTLTYNSQGKPSLGGFKLSLYGIAQPAISEFASRQVAIKQCYDHIPDHLWQEVLTTTDPGLAAGILKSHPTIYVLESGDQIVHLSREIICAQWADALMNLVYDWIAARESQMGRSCPYDIPRL